MGFESLGRGNTRRPAIYDDSRSKSKCGADSATPKISRFGRKDGENGALKGKKHSTNLYCMLGVK